MNSHRSRHVWSPRALDRVPRTWCLDAWGLGSGALGYPTRYLGWGARSARLCGGLLAGLLVLTQAACETTPNQKAESAVRMMQRGNVEEAQTLLEATVKEAPENPRVHLALSSAYFDRARAAFSAGDEAEYLKYLEKCQEEALRGVELDPDSATGHNLLGLVAIYRGDIDAAADSFNIARQLDPVSPVFYLNLAELEVYRGKLARARRNIELARKFRAPPGDVELVEVLAAWKRGDYVEARDIFDDVALLEPDRARTWNGATSIETFDDMAAYCCQLEFCGPYMKRACKDIDQKVAERKREIETIRRELELEVERNKRISDIYRDRDIEISVEGDKGDKSEEK